MTLLRRASLRFYLRHPWQLGLAITGISLGVGVYVGVSLANDSAARAFDVAAAEVRGAITHRILPLDGSLDEQLFRDLVMRDGALLAAPVVEGEVGIAGRADLRVPLLGIEPIRQGGRLRVAAAAGNDAGFLRLIVEPNTVLLSEDAGDRARRAERRAAVGGGCKVASGSCTCSASCRRPASTSEPSRRSWPTSRRRRSCSERSGESAGSTSRSRRRRRARSLPRYPQRHARSRPKPSAARFRELTTAFRTNLTALGLLALVVGMFLIYGTMAFAILQRTQTLGILRTLGVSRGGNPANDPVGNRRDRGCRDGARAVARPRARDRARRSRAADDRRSVIQRGRRRRRSIAVDLRAGRSARLRRDADRGRQTGARRRAHRARRRTASRSARAARAFRGATCGLCRRAAPRGQRLVARVRSESDLCRLRGLVRRARSRRAADAADDGCF